MSKQYLLICNEVGMALLNNLFKSEAIQFLEVQGMSVSTGNVNLLVTPIIPPVNPMEPIDQVITDEAPIVA